MPKIAPAALFWVAEQQIYTISEQGSAHCRPLPEDEEQWHAWLASCFSFSFQGQSGRLTLRKESRRGEDHYWYAYRRQGGRLAKRYIGRTADVTLERLEAAARVLTASDSAGSSPVPRAKMTPTEQGTTFQEHSMRAPGRNLGPLLVWKLSLPQPHSSLILRERLLAHLDDVLGHKLTLLAAPAGFGKTTLVSQWAAYLQTRRPPLPVAWVSLDAGENDLLRFWRYVITACQVFQADLGEAALALLPGRSPSRQVSQEAVLTALLNDLAALPTKGVLVLDEYHAISNAQIHETLAAFVDHLPPALHLVLISRQEPPLPLARLRAQNELVELHAEDLRFSLEETSAFFQRTTPFQLSAETIEHVAGRAEGWVAGLHLLAFALHRQESAQQAERFLTTLTGEHRHLLAYFVTEVLSAQPEPLQRFLLQTSVLGSLTGSLCDAVTGRSDSEALLETLERANVFLQALDDAGQWYRYHALFAEAMQHEARRRFGADALQTWYRRASGWYEQQGILSEAIEMACSAREFARVATLLEQNLRPHHAYVIMHEYHTLHRWLDSLPQDILEQHPQLCVRVAMLLLFPWGRRADGQPSTLAQIEHLLRTAETSWQAEDNTSGIGQIFAFRSLLSREQGNATLAARLARQALPRLSDTDQQWRGLCFASIGTEEMLAGRTREARQFFQEARFSFEAAGNSLGARATLLALGETCFLEGALRQAAACYREVSASAGEDLSDKAKALLGLAQLSYEWNALEEAWQEAEEALALGTRLDDEALQAQASLVLAEIAHARGARAQAQQQLYALLAQLPGVPTHHPSLLYQRIQACQARFLLAAGDLAAAERWSTMNATQRESLPRLYQEQEDLIAARLLMARGQPQEALSLLTYWRAETHAQGRMRSEVESLILMALATNAAGRPAQATSGLREALSLAQTEGYQRLFLDEGEDLVSLLRMLLPTIRKDPCVPYVRLLLHASAGASLEQSASWNASDPGSALSFSPLSPQEQRVLRLLAAGYSNPEIAEALVVSINTVKTQVRSIYQKLNVQSRKEARAALHSQNQR
jgi:LuxR family transcriptional regulator, maltose regulon positive regulatory protein